MKMVFLIFFISMMQTVKEAMVKVSEVADTDLSVSANKAEFFNNCVEHLCRCLKPMENGSRSCGHSKQCNNQEKREHFLPGQIEASTEKDRCSYIFADGSRCVRQQIGEIPVVKSKDLVSGSFPEFFFTDSFSQIPQSLYSALDSFAERHSIKHGTIVVFNKTYTDVFVRTTISKILSEKRIDGFSFVGENGVHWLNIFSYLTNEAWDFVFERLKELSSEKFYSDFEIFSKGDRVFGRITASFFTKPVNSNSGTPFIRFSNGAMLFLGFSFCNCSSYDFVNGKPVIAPCKNRI